ncbi:conserved hypothetical protein [Ricinus communis]|uniref:RNase H type-1 domain-containing protein n=1 Tax=Ricinus communis TaxID=3988 RepID=B9RRI9_RICCO|nr:conserved hypothetical protein [Ricinus communis]
MRFRGLSPRFKAKKYPLHDDPYCLESLALRDAVLWALFKDWNNIIFEGDCKGVIDAINGLASPFTSGVMIIKNIL